jgi:hypothetical protein
MRKLCLALALLMTLLTGCNSLKPVSTETPVHGLSSSSGSGSFFTITEIGLGENGYVALTNITDQPVSLEGLFLCQGTQCSELPKVEVAPGSTAQVAIGEGTGLSQAVETQALIGELRPSDGEIGLYASQDVRDPKEILAYLEWGSTPHADTQVAIDAGLWIKGSYAPSAKDAKRLFRQETGLWLFDTK